MGPIAGSKTDWFEKALLDALFGGAVLTIPTTWYVSLSTAAYSEAATGAAGMNEVAGGGYARAAATNNSTNFPAATGTSPGTKTTGVAITYPAASAAWGTVASFYLCDALTGGNAWYGGDLTASKTIQTGDTASFAAGQLTVTED